VTVAGVSLFKGWVNEIERFRLNQSFCGTHGKPETP